MKITDVRTTAVAVPTGRTYKSTGGALYHGSLPMVAVLAAEVKPLRKALMRTLAAEPRRRARKTKEGSRHARRRCVDS